MDPQLEAILRILGQQNRQPNSGIDPLNTSQNQSLGLPTGSSLALQQPGSQAQAPLSPTAPPPPASNMAQYPATPNLSVNPTTPSGLPANTMSYNTILGSQPPSLNSGMLGQSPLTGMLGQSPFANNALFQQNMAAAQPPSNPVAYG